MTVPAKSSAQTVADWLALPDDAPVELVDGELVEKASPGFEHGSAQSSLSGLLVPEFHRRGGGGRPGGWWIASEVAIRLGPNVLVPDLVGWRRDRVPVMPRELPIGVRPDWVCEILSDSNASTDLVVKLRRYHQGGVPHYWVVDPRAATLTVYRHQPEGYLNVAQARKGETLRAEPFGALELRVGLLFGEDPDDPPVPVPD